MSWYAAAAGPRCRAPLSMRNYARAFAAAKANEIKPWRHVPVVVMLIGDGDARAGSINEECACRGKCLRNEHASKMAHLNQQAKASRRGSLVACA